VVFRRTVTVGITSKLSVAKIGWLEWG
jgi:hypothetical protein